MGTPDDSDIGTDTNIIVTVSDGKVTASLASFSIVVTSENNEPTISGAPSTNVTEDVTYSFTPLANDVDEGDVLSFSINKVMATDMAWATFSRETGTWGRSAPSDLTGETQGTVC